MKKIFPLIFLFLSTCFAAFPQSIVEFQVNGIPTKHAKNVGIRGNQVPLSWDKSIPLKKMEDDYRVTLEFPGKTTEIEFKFVLFDSDEKPSW